MSKSELKHELNITDVTIRWKIKNIWNSRKHGSMSTPFTILGQRVNLYIRKYESSLDFYLYFDDLNVSVLQFYFTLSFISSCSEELVLVEKRITTDEAKELVLLKKLVISDAEKKMYNILQYDDMWIISCLVSSVNQGNLGNVKKCEPTENPVVLCFETLSSDFEQFYSSHRNCDVILKAEDIEFSVHRSILSARSTKFASILNHQTLECHNEVIHISDIKAAVLREILYYIYSSKIRGLNPDTAIQLFAAADNYCLFELKDACLSFLLSNLTLTNVLDVSVLAHKQDNKVLKEKVDNFFSKNITEIFLSERWKQFSVENPKLANEILTDLLLGMQKVK